MLRGRLLFLSLLLTCFGMNLPLSAQQSAPSSNQKYTARWDSLDTRPTPQWYTDAKFGIFIHWGVYSVPAWAPVGKYAEWYWHDLNKGKKAPESNSKDRATWNFHVKAYGENFPYQDFAPMFKAELYDPDRWAEVFRKSGARYVVLTSKHHDGFCLWPSQEANKTWGRPWNSVDIGPKRDLLGELTGAVRRKGLKMGFYYSLYEWFNPLWLTDKKRYINEHMHPQFRDVVTRYQPAVIFSDGEWDLPSSEWRSQELLAWLFNESPVRDEVVVNDRWGKDTRHKHGGYYTTEYGSGLPDAKHPWEESRGMGYSYGYNRMETLSDYRTAKELILMLVDTVSRGGNLLLDIGPTADGRIPVIMEERLTQIGEWLKINGEGIYETQPWRQTRQWSAGKIPEVKYGEYMTGYDISKMIGKPAGDAAVIEAFFTVKGNNLYAITPAWPGKQMIVKDITPSKETVITLLGMERPLKWEAVKGNLVIQLPALHVDEIPRQEAYVFKISKVQSRKSSIVNRE